MRQVITRRRLRTALGSVILAAVLLYLQGSAVTGDSAGQISDGSIRRRVPQRYTPGRIGQKLLKRFQEVNTAKNSQSGWTQTISSSRELFGSRPLEDPGAIHCQLEDAPEGFVVGSDSPHEACERLALLQELTAWTPHPTLISPWLGVGEKNNASIDRLSSCLLEPLPLDPKEPGGCSIKTKQIVIGLWGFFTYSFLRLGASGEQVWMIGVIDAMQEEGYTVLAAPEYVGVIEAHAAMPNLITHILAEDRFVLTCLGDPECIAPSDFVPTQTLFPDMAMDEDGEPILTQNMKGWFIRPKQKWYWKEEELQALTRRGTIPRWKLFCTTWWAAVHQGDFGRVPEEFSWNPLGPEWTVSPFAYPNYTDIPFTLERECTKVPIVDKEEEVNEVFVLAKLARYYYKPDKAPLPSTWLDFEAESGLTPTTMAPDVIAEGDQEAVFVPKGLTKIDRMSREGFLQRLGKSKVMLGIGSPRISPSVYDSLCQGTPVVMPIYHPIEELTGYKIWDDNYAQHGPASLIGPPYVYSYRHQNETELFEAIRLAAETPIPRYIPKGMTWEDLKQNVNDFLLFDWKRLAEGIVEAEPYLLNAPHRYEIIARCFEMGQCNMEVEKPGI